MVAGGVASSHLASRPSNSRSTVENGVTFVDADETSHGSDTVQLFVRTETVPFVIGIVTTSTQLERCDTQFPPSSHE